MILVSGFDVFGAVRDNPSARLARALHATSIAGHAVVSIVLPVSWSDGPRRVVQDAQRLRPTLVVGFGVATTRATLDVETIGQRRAEGVDADGREPPRWPDGEPVAASADTTRFADAANARCSTDAGRYLCNAWLVTVVPAVGCPALFVHVPGQPELPDDELLARVRRGLEALVSAPSAY